MKVCKYIVIITILLFNSINVVSADACDNDDIKRLKVIAENVEITYQYNDNIYDSDGFMIYDTYKVFINNMTDELYVYESKTDTDLSGYSIKDGLITIDRMYSGKKSFKIYSKACDKVLKTKYVTLPKFNYYYTDPNCKGRDDLEVCEKFYDSSNLEYSEFYNIILNYENDNDKVDEDDDNKTNDKFTEYLNFVKENYLYFGVGLGLLLLLIIIVIVLRHRKRGVLE